MTMTATTPETADSRYHGLKTMLEERRRALSVEVQSRLRDARTQNVHERDVLDESETSDVDRQEEIEFTLIQMKTETLDRIATALTKISEGTYGICAECGHGIAELRLRALPFAVRCKDCEESREIADQRERFTAWRSSPSHVVDTSNSSWPRTQP